MLWHHADWHNILACTAPQFRRQAFSSSPLWEPQIIPSSCSLLSTLFSDISVCLILCHAILLPLRRIGIFSCYMEACLLACFRHQLETWHCMGAQKQKHWKYIELMLHITATGTGIGWLALYCIRDNFPKKWLECFMFCRKHWKSM
jgi:hypothetical protein